MKNGRKSPKSAAKLELDILEMLRKEGLKSFNYKQVSARLKLKGEKERRLVEALLKKLVNQELIEEIERGKFRYKYNPTYLVGRVDMTSRGAAYVIPQEEGYEGDVYIGPAGLNRALDGDLVKVLLYARRKNKKLEGEVESVIERARTEFVGTVELSKNYGFLIADSRKMQVDIYIPDTALKGVKHGQKAIAKITDWPEKASSPFGEIVEVLGNPGEHEVEIHSILAEFGLPRAFPKQVEREAQEVVEEIPQAEIDKRRDFRKITTFTIDPVDAKDFDDALSLRVLENGHYEIGVHIADVTHYVRPGSALEEEAVERATSVYLVDRVVPMLPEKLSNKVCSLRPHEEKLTFSAVFEMNEQAEVLKRWFGRTVIKSDHRFAYEDAQKIIEGEDGPLSEEVRLLDKLAKILRKRRMEKGAIAFDKREVKFHLDEDNQPTGVYFKQSKDANHLIEEFMLLANKAVAQVVGKLPDGNPSKRTMVYRIHDSPDPDKLLELANFARQFGHEVNLKERHSVSRNLNKLLRDVQGKGEGNMIETLAVRTMAKAVYSTENIGHYGLAFDYYTHFTSPIRRYPDMMVHRLLQTYLDGAKNPDRAHYEELCEHSSERERLATDAERASTKYMQVKFMEQHVGEYFMGVISGVTEWGVFVELIDNYCEGMIRIRDFKDDYYNFDERNFCIVGERKGKVFQLGDQIRIRVKQADLDKKQLDFVPA